MPDYKELARQARNEYNRRWYAEHKEQRKAKKMLAEKEAEQDEQINRVEP